MAAVLVVLLSLGSVTRGFAQGGAGRPFITKWQGKAGEELKIPIVGTDYKLVIKNEKGEEVKTEEKVTVTGEGEAYYHPFTPSADGVYTVEAGPEGVKYMRMREEWKSEEKKNIPITSNEQLLEVVQFGTVAWESMKQMFCRCKNMIFAADVDTPDLTKVSDMYEMFFGCSSFNQPLNNWDVSQVTKMNEMFVGCTSFNQPLEKWNVSKVTNMYGMFYDCHVFNQQLGEWNVSKVTNMGSMFRGCRAFNQPLNNWNVSKVTNMSDMFYDCSSFNQPLNNWTVSQVTNMRVMFTHCHSFNQPLNNWDVSQVSNMNLMFARCHSFNQPLNNWNVSQVTDMGGMFAECHAFNQPLNNWTVNQVTDMSGMFSGCTSFNQPLEKWDVSKVTNMGHMFEGCSAFNQPLEKWEVSKVTYMGHMFMGCTSFNQPLNNWTVSQVADMRGMFASCRAFNQPLEKWDVSKVTNMRYMFKDCSSFNQPLGAWKLQTAIEGLSTTAMSAVNYSLSLIGWAKQTDGASNIKFGEEVKGLIYNDAGKAAREKLISRGWTFEGDVYKPSEKVAIILNKEGEGTLAIEGYNEEALKAVAVGTELTVIATPKDGYSLTSLMAGSQDIFATKKFTVTGAVTVKAVFKKNGGSNPGGGNGGGNNGGNNGGGNNGGAWQPQKPGTAVEDAVLASLAVAPNPFTSQLRIDNPEGVAVRYELVTLTGSVVRAGAFVATEMFVDTEALPAGGYFVRIEAQNGAKRVMKVVKY